MANITINEVRRRLQAFAKEHASDSDEKQHAQQFWRDFYQCFGLSKSSASMFEARVVKLGGERGYIDSFIPSLLLVEQKSLGKDLQSAYAQATSYFHAIKEEIEKPRYIVTCDFQTFNLYDLHSTSKEPLTCKLEELHKRADWFMFLADKKLETIIEESPINRKAAYQVSLLHEALLKANFKGRDLEIFLTRLLFCFFSDDTAIFGSNNQFKKLVESTREDGRDTGATIAELFQVLNQSHAERQTTLDEQLQAFEYINGNLFAEQTRIPSFNYELRQQLIECNKLDWSDISPAIFGAMFQAVLETQTEDNAARKESRRELGAHYTSERNILRVINPLFLDGLRAEFDAVKKNKTKLQAFYNKLPTLKFFDPACGCGNFLVIAFRELRRLENEVIGALFGDTQRGLLDVSHLCQVNVGQFYGIEIDEAAAHIARVAMWITDHQLNIEAAARFGTTRPTVPLITSPHITCANALRIDWNDTLPAQECSYLMGNPPFIGKQNQTNEQRDDMAIVFSNIKNYGLLDYVTAWYLKAVNYADKNRKIHIAFVSTNSISQGEQPAVLWRELFKRNIFINFAHRTFRWSNEGKGVAAVHCVVIGLTFDKPKKCYLYDYGNDISGEPQTLIVSRINPYLVEADDVLIENRRTTICNVDEMIYGSKPTDGGNLLLTEDEMIELVRVEPSAKKWIRKFVGADEFINNIPRYCLWLLGIEPQELKAMPKIYERVEAVKKMRLASTKIPTQLLASTPNVFAEIRYTNNPYLLIPSVSSEKRSYIPIGYMDAEVICSNANFMLPNATLYHFSVLNSSMHNAWMRAVCGRLESRYRYSNTIVYNNFAWITNASAEQIDAIEKAGKAILDARSLYPNSSLASLYDPVTMPTELVKAHQANNKAVDKAYGYKGTDDDASRVAFLFKLYEQTTSLLPILTNKKAKRTKSIS